MSDRFDFLEIGDAKPSTLPPSDDSGPTPGGSANWKRLCLRAVEVFGEPGTEAGQFNTPTGLAVDAWGVLYVADSGNHRVQRITPAGEVRVFGRPGLGSGQMWEPQAVTVDASGRYLFVAEQGAHRIHCFRTDNGLSEGFATGFRAPSGVAFDAEGMLWIADTGNARLLRLDVRTGQFVSILDYKVGVQRPIAVACDNARNVWVTESVQEDVVRYTIAGVRCSAVSDFRRLSAPRGIAVDAQGRLYVTESGANRLHVLDAHGHSLMTFEITGPKYGSLNRPAGVAIGSNGEIYLADTGNHRIFRLIWE